MELSIIITAHSEGLLAHKTMLSVERALKDLACDYEVIVHIDKGTPETIGYFERHQRQSGYKVLKNDFGDAGRSRNYAVSVAMGEYIIFLDADDIVSKDYFVRSLEVLKNSSEPTLVHPQYCLSFEDRGDFYSLCKMYDSDDIPGIELKMFMYNQWISSVGGKKELFIETPYIITENGYGHEDYSFNIETLAAGVKHVVAPQATYFYRRKKTSLIHENNSASRTQPYSTLFDFARCKEIELTQTEQASLPQRMKHYARSGYVWARDHKLGNFILEPVANVGKKVLRKESSLENKVPEAVMRAWKEASQIETQLYPTNKRLRYLDFYDCSGENEVGQAYWKICQQVKTSEPVDYVFIVPWVIRGGADKVLLNYLKAFEELSPETRVAVITTLPAKNLWKDKLPKNTVFVDFGNIAKKLDEESKETLFTRTVVQLRPKYLHIINSQYGYEWVNSHRELITNNFKLNLSLFCYDIIPQTNGEGRFDYADPYAVCIYDVVDHIYTDNSVLMENWIRDNDFQEDKITVEYQPTKKINAQEVAKFDDGKFHIAWASRICTQKNPELLVEIAKGLGDEFQIDVFGKFEPKYTKSMFAQARNIRYMGEFNGAESLPLKKYDLFLYTSLVDGLPNMVLEVASLGVPIVASNAGGIGDFIRNGETGLLVNDLKKPGDYIEAIQYAEKHRDELASYSLRALDLLEKQHSWQSYLDAIEKDFGAIIKAK